MNRVLNNRINASIFSKFAILVNFIALIIYNQISFNLDEISDIYALNGLLLITIGAQNVLIASIIRLSFLSQNKSLDMKKLSFFELLKQSKINKIFLIYILSAVMIISYTGNLMKINLFVLISFSIVMLLANISFFYYAIKNLNETKSTNIIAFNGLIFIFASCTYTILNFSKLLLLYYPLGGLIFSFVLKDVH